MTVRVEIDLNGVPVPLVLDDEALATIAAATGPRPDAEQWPEWMSVETAARYLDVPAERLRKLVARRAIPFAQEAVGCRISFSRRDLDAWMHDQRNDARGRP